MSVLPYALCAFACWREGSFHFQICVSTESCPFYKVIIVVVINNNRWKLGEGNSYPCLSPLIFFFCISIQKE